MGGVNLLGSFFRLYRDNGKENGSYYSILGLYFKLQYSPLIAVKPRAASGFLTLSL